MSPALPMAALVTAAAAVVTLADPTGRNDPPPSFITAPSMALAAGPDSAQVVRLFTALAAADPVVCELAVNRLGNGWWCTARPGPGDAGEVAPRGRCSTASTP